VRFSLLKRAAVWLGGIGCGVGKRPFLWGGESGSSSGQKRKAALERTRGRLEKEESGSFDRRGGLLSSENKDQSLL